jgi:hypothetical protein
MKKALAIILIPVLLLGLSVLSSCKGKSEKRQQKIVEMSQVKTIENEIEKNVYPLPTSAEVIKMLTELEVGYIIGISNPVANSKKYLQVPNGQ